MAKKMIKFISDSGNEAYFEEGISEKQVNERLGWMGGKWKKVKEKELRKVM